MNVTVIYTIVNMTWCSIMTTFNMETTTNDENALNEGRRAIVLALFQNIPIQKLITNDISIFNNWNILISS